MELQALGCACGVRSPDPAAYQGSLSLSLSLSLTLYLDLYHELLWSSRFIYSSELDIVIDVTRSMTRIDIDI